jgi:hypothetical protein
MASLGRSCSCRARRAINTLPNLNMKNYIYGMIVGLLGGIAAWSQPAMTSTNISIDIDGNGVGEFLYTIGASGPFDDFPVRWYVDCGLDVVGGARFLRAASGRVFFEQGESLNESREIYQETSSTSVIYGLGIMGYQAESYFPSAPDSWRYTTSFSNPLFENLTEVLLGARLVVNEVVHYGWLRVSRPVVDNHTLFDVSGYDWNPIPRAPIGAGEPPGPPPLLASLSGEGQLNFDWNTGYGEMLLEWTASLTGPVDWQPVPDSSAPPVQLSLAEAGQSFFRLRKP